MTLDLRTLWQEQNAIQTISVLVKHHPEQGVSSHCWANALGYRLNPLGHSRVITHPLLCPPPSPLGTLLQEGCLCLRHLIRFFMLRRLNLWGDTCNCSWIRKTTETLQTTATMELETERKIVFFVSNAKVVSFMLHVSLLSSLLLRSEVTCYHRGLTIPVRWVARQPLSTILDWWICMRLGAGHPKWDFLAGKGYGLVCDFSCRCLFFRFTPISLQNCSCLNCEPFQNWM